MRLAAYKIALSQYSREAFDFLVSEAIRTCRFYPSTSECVEIINRWHRNDKASRHKRKAAVAVRNELQARLEETLKRIDAGEVSQDEVDAMPEQWRQVAEARGLLRLNEDRSYVLRQRRAVPQHSPSNAPARCSECQGVGRVLMMDGTEADCGCVEKQEMAA